MLNALLTLKKSGFINRATEAKYLGCHGADHVFGLADGRVVALDPVFGRVVRVNGGAV